MGRARTVRSSVSADTDGDPSVDRARARRAVRSAAPRLERNLRYTAYTMKDLRSAQDVLQEEVSRVEYWQRILRAKPGGGRHRLGADHDQVVRVLSAARTSPQRFAFVGGSEADVVLPDLVELWTRPTDPSDETASQRRALDLGEADRSLATYLADLNTLVRLLKGEVIVRYREDPGLALLLLPATDEHVARAYG